VKVLGDMDCLIVDSSALEMRLGCKGFIYPALTIFFPFYADVDFCM
jgi:hypothetical protein